MTKICVVNGRNHFIRFRRECPYLKTKAEYVGWNTITNPFCQITSDFYFSDRLGNIPRNCPLEDAK